MSEIIVPSSLPSSIFNMDKADYENTPLFLGEEPGLFDTVNKQYPKIWKLYKEMKSLDWDENEFDYSSCNADFRTCSPDTYEAMIMTLAWQWESDSIASRSIASVVSPFISSSELWAAWQRVSDNEVVHAATYSEIVRNSFDDPSTILNEVLRVKQSHGRLKTVSKALEMIYKRAHQYALGLVPNDQETYNMAFLFPVTMLLLERIPFMSSFAVTFSICDTGLFQPIGKAVQKIAQDELEVHVQLDKAVLEIEMQTDRGKRAFKELHPLITEMWKEITFGELSWNKHLFSGNRQLVGVTNPLLDNWSLFNAGEPRDILKITDTDGLDIPEKNPLKFMERWLDISNTQPSPQEQDNAQYRVGLLTRDDEGEDFSEFSDL